MITSAEWHHPAGQERLAVHVVAWAAAGGSPAPAWLLCRERRCRGRMLDPRQLRGRRGADD